MAKNTNLYIDQGANFSALLTIQHSNTVSVNLAPYTPSAVARKSYYGTENVEFTTSRTDNTNGQMKISLTSVQTGNMDPRLMWRYEVNLTNTSNLRTRILEGNILLNPSTGGQNE